MQTTAQLEAPKQPKRIERVSWRRKRRDNRAGGRRTTLGTISPDDARRQFEDHADWILETAFLIGRRNGLAEVDADEFVGWATLRLVRRDFAVLRSCRDPKRIRGYLSRVLRNLAKDFRNHLWGKWRPTSTAKNAGRYAIEFERLCLRDGFSAAEALRYLECNRAHCPDTETLEDIARRIPMRPRPHQVPLDVATLGRLGAVEEDPSRFESRRAVLQVRTHLSAALRALDDDDRELLGLLFDDGRSVASIAREQNLDQRALYSRRDRCLRRLRRILRDRGVDWPDVADALGS